MICHGKKNSLPCSIKTPFVKSKIKKKIKRKFCSKNVNTILWNQAPRESGLISIRVNHIGRYWSLLILFIQFWLVLLISDVSGRSKIEGNNTFFFNCVSRLFEECSLIFLWVFQGCFKDVLTKV